MEKFQKAKLISSIVFRSIWLGFSLLVYFVGVSLFNEFRGNEKAFVGWMIWGFCCAVTIIPFIWKTVRGSASDGAKQGANTYTASASGNNIYVSNHPFLGAIMGFILGIFICLLMGPVVSPIYMIMTIMKIVNSAVDLKRG